MRTKTESVTLPDDLKKAIEGLPLLAANFLLCAKIDRLKFDAYVENGFSPEQALYLLKR
jgi:hypothetical protein